jgi:hypothetical protein
MHASGRYPVCIEVYPYGASIVVAARWARWSYYVCTDNAIAPSLLHQPHFVVATFVAIVQT